MLQNNNFCVIWGAGYKCFYFMEKLSSVQDIQVLAFLTIPWFTKSVTSWWVLVHETGCIFQCLIQKKFGNIDFSWVSWVVLLIWHYNNIYSGLKCVLFICKLENYKKDPLLIIFGEHFSYLLTAIILCLDATVLNVLWNTVIKSPNLGNW